MIEVIVKNNSSDAFEKAFRKFNKLCEKDGFVQELKYRQYFKSPAEKLKDKRRKNAIRIKHKI